MKAVAVLLAAGESTRAEAFKPLLPWFGARLVERQAQALLRGGAAEVLVVTGHRAEEVEGVLRGERVRTVRNPRYREGKATSVRAGVFAVPPDADAIVILSVDQPRPAWLIRRALEAHAAAGRPITRLSHRGRAGHPLVVAASLRGELEKVADETRGIREVLRAHAAEVHWVEADTPLARLDLNTPGAYREALALFPDPRLEARD